MRVAKLQGVALSVALLVGFDSAFAQHSFDRTISVDLRTIDDEPVADFDDIQEAIDDGVTGNDPTVKWTILIYPGLYELTAPITLDGLQENIDLVGIDRDSVIISVSGTGQQSGIVITSGTETSRNNRIANLTIITTNGHGIEIVKGGTPVPKDIEIEGVTIQAGGDGMNGIDGAVATDVRVFDCEIETEAVANAGAGGHGMDIGDGWTIQNVMVNAQAEPTSEGNAAGISMSGIDGVTIENSQISSKHTRGMSIIGDSKNVTVRSCTIRGGWVGIRILLGDHILLDSCEIIADNTATDEMQLVALFIDRLSGGGQLPPTDIVALNCRIEAVGAGADSMKTYETVGVRTDTDSFPTVIECKVIARAVKDKVFGVLGGKGSQLEANIIVIGGSVTTSVDDEQETEVFDLKQNNPGEGTGRVLVSGTRMSRWKGPIESAERPRPITQRTLNVDSASATEIVNSVDLDGATITVGASGILDAYRTVQATWNSPSGSDITITVFGTNWADEDIAENFLLKVARPNQNGFKPFKTVTDIFIPSASGTLSVGTTNKLGLYYPIASTSDVLQQGRKTSSATSYTLESITPSDIDATYSTVDVSSTIVDGDSFEWALLASQ